MVSYYLCGVLILMLAHPLCKKTVDARFSLSDKYLIPISQNFVISWLFIIVIITDGVIQTKVIHT